MIIQNPDRFELFKIRRNIAEVQSMLGRFYCEKNVSASDEDNLIAVETHQELNFDVL